MTFWKPFICMDCRCLLRNAFMQRENAFQSSPQTQNAGLLSVERALFQKNLVMCLFWTARRALPSGEDKHPGCVILQGCILNVGVLCINSDTGTFLNLQRKYSLILKGRGNLKFILTPLGNLWLCIKLVNDEIWTLFQIYLPSISQKFLRFWKPLIRIFKFCLEVVTLSLPWINAEGLELNIGEWGWVKF